MSHTPGPWHVVVQTGFPAGIEVHAANGSHVVCFGHEYDAYGGVDAADAALIASAPELLDALKYLLELCGDDDRRIVAEAAIAKAKGLL